MIAAPAYLPSLLSSAAGTLAAFALDGDDLELVGAVALDLEPVRSDPGMISAGCSETSTIGAIRHSFTEFFVSGEFISRIAGQLHLFYITTHAELNAVNLVYYLVYIVEVRRPNGVRNIYQGNADCWEQTTRTANNSDFMTSSPPSPVR